MFFALCAFSDQTISISKISPGFEELGIFIEQDKTSQNLFFKILISCSSFSIRFSCLRLFDSNIFFNQTSAS